VDTLVDAHPLVDGIVGHLAWCETLADRVYYSEPLAGFLGWASARGVRPVLVTRPNGRITYPLAHHVWAAGALWVCRVDGGYRDQRSGMIYPSLAAVPFAAGDEDVAAPVLDRSHVWVGFSVSVQHPATPATRVGDVVEVVWQELTGTLPVSWGWHEPCLSRWDRDAYTASARTVMPAGDLVVSGASRHPIQAVGQVRRNHQGVGETVSGLAVAGVAGMDMSGLAAQAVGTLRQVATMIPTPVIGVISVLRGGPEIQLGVPLVEGVWPVAVLIGPGLAQTVGADVRRFAADHDGIVAGRGWAPSLVLPLTGSGTGVWRRLRALIAEFAPNDLTAGWADTPHRPGSGVGDAA